MQRDEIDLERLDLRSGQAEAVELDLEPAPPVVGGQAYPIEGSIVRARVEVSRTTSGYALRLLADVVLGGPCARCLEPAELRIPIDAREVSQPGSDDAELSSPYVDDGILAPTAWLHDAITLALPDKVLCRPDCAGICEVCGAQLNDVGPEHGHAPPPDPRFAKLRELIDDD
jgi:uncharacterized protein